MATKRWPDNGRDASSGAMTRAQNMSRYYFSNGGGRDTYVASIKDSGKFQGKLQMFHEGQDRFDKSTKHDQILKRNQRPDLPSACTLPPPRNPSYHSDSMGRLLSPLPTDKKFRPNVRRSKARPDPLNTVIATDKITQFFPPATKMGSRSPHQVTMADEPSASFAGHVPRSPKTPTRSDELAQLNLPPRVPRDTPASAKTKAKILGYTGHVPQRRYDLDGKGSASWERSDILKGGKYAVCTDLSPSPPR